MAISTRTTAYYEDDAKHNGDMAVSDIAKAEVPITFPLKMFASEIKKLHPRCKFGYERSYQDRIWVYRPEDILCMGWIGYGDFTNSDEEHEDRFLVYSHNIKNYKYSEWSYQFYSSSAKELRNAVRAASKHLRPWADDDAAGVLHKDAREAWITEKSDDGKNVTNALYSIRHSDDLRAELLHLHKLGHTFCSSEFAEGVERLVKAEGIYLDNNKYRINTVSMVYHTTDKRGEEVFRVCTSPNIIKEGYWGRGDARWESDGHFAFDDLPKDIKDRLTSLSVASERVYIPGVGYKDRGNLYFVARDV